MYYCIKKKVKFCVLKYDTPHTMKAASLHENKPSVCAQHQGNEFDKLSLFLAVYMQVTAHVQQI